MHQDMSKQLSCVGSRTGVQHQHLHALYVALRGLHSLPVHWGSTGSPALHACPSCSPCRCCPPIPSVPCLQVAFKQVLEGNYRERAEGVPRFFARDVDFQHILFKAHGRDDAWGIYQARHARLLSACSPLITLLLGEQTCTEGR